MELIKTKIRINRAVRIFPTHGFNHTVQNSDSPACIFSYLYYIYLFTVLLICSLILRFFQIKNIPAASSTTPTAAPTIQFEEDIFPDQFYRNLYFYILYSHK